MEGKRKKLTWQLPFLVLLIIGTYIIIRSQNTTPYQHNQGYIFGTIYNITYQSPKNLNDEIVAALNEVDASLSPFNDSSVITKVNKNEDVKINDMLREVFEKAMDVSKATDGAFDITVAPLVNAWGFGFKSGNSLTKEQIDSVKEFVGYKKLSLRNNRIVKADPRLMLDCSAIAKGYGTDVLPICSQEKASITSW